MLKLELCPHVVVLPEAAGIVFGGGFPRNHNVEARRAAQRAIYHVQRELETAFALQPVSVLLCDRGTVDGMAYWPGPEDFWKTLGTTRRRLLASYDVVIHLRVPKWDGGYSQANPLRIESAAEARRIDDRILEAWEGHPHRVVIESAPDFVEKARRAVEAIRRELPRCCARISVDGLASGTSGIRRRKMSGAPTLSGALPAYGEIK